MHAYLPVAVAGLALAGCQAADEKHAAATGEVRLSNASMKDVARLTKAARAKTLMQPGQWQTALRVVSTDLSAFPDGNKRDAQMQAIKNQERSAQGCRTVEELKPFDIENLEQVAGKCVFPRYNQAGGKIDAEIHCSEGASKTVLLVTGTLSPAGYDVTIDQKTGALGAANYLGLKIRAIGNRVGNCIAKVG
ncbi:MAG: DUF3617 family protein [Alphaproteobacteria bacterium]|nr:MAG: DUF3617 family protein [Alphaproteobacteria bacterium]